MLLCYPLGHRPWQKLMTSIASALRPPERRQGGEAPRSSKLIPLALPSCKGCWEMSSVAGQPRDQLMLTSLKERRQPTGPGASHTHQATHSGQPAPAEGAERPTYGAPLQRTPRPEESTLLEDPQPFTYKRPRLQGRLTTNPQDSKKRK